jgi:hypothetical protein
MVWPPQLPKAFDYCMGNGCSGYFHVRFLGEGVDHMGGSICPFCGRVRRDAEAGNTVVGYVLH